MACRVQKDCQARKEAKETLDLSVRWELRVPIRLFWKRTYFKILLQDFQFNINKIHFIAQEQRAWKAKTGWASFVSLFETIRASIIEEVPKGKLIKWSTHLSLQPRGFAGVGKIGEKGDRGPKGFRGRDCDQTAMDGSITKIVPHDGEKGDKGDKVGISNEIEWNRLSIILTVSFALQGEMGVSGRPGISFPGIPGEGDKGDIGPVGSVGPRVSICEFQEIWPSQPELRMFLGWVK